MMMNSEQEKPHTVSVLEAKLAACNEALDDVIKERDDLRARLEKLSFENLANKELATDYSQQLATAQRELEEARRDSRRLDWLERNLLNLSHLRATNSVDMGGNCVRGQLYNEARGDKAGPSYFRIWHPTIRAGLDAAMEARK